MSASAANGMQRSKYLLVFFLLVGSCIVAIIGTVSLSHWVTGRYADAVKTNRAWAGRLALMEELRNFANDVNAPANDVFASKDAQAELDKQRQAFEKFNARQLAIYNGVLQGLSNSQKESIRPGIARAIATVQEINAKGDITLRTYQAGDVTEAGAHMAAMDQALRAFTDISNSVEEVAHKLQQENFDIQATSATQARTIEIWIGVAIVAIVIWLAVYGMKIYRTTTAISVELERAMKLAQEREIHIRAIVNGASDGIITVDQHGNIESFNAAGEKMFGYASGEALEKNITMLVASASANGAENNAAMDFNELQNMIGQSHELAARRKDGSRFPLQLTLSLIPLATATKYVGILRDISEWKQVQQRLAAARDAANSANLAKSEFLANMSHEIRTPITAIVGFSDMMLDPDQTLSDRFDGLQTIRRNAQHLLGLINDILDISKIEAGKMTVERASCDLPLLLGEVMSMLQARALEKEMQIRLSLDSPIPKTIVTDPLRLKQILVNLLSNAIKFASRGTVQLRVSYAGGPLGFAVIDDGIGMTREQLSRLFQPFTQADNSTTRRFGGSGLGLTISKRLAQLLGGDIGVTSEPGKGSTFKVWIDPGAAGDSLVENIEEVLLYRAAPSSRNSADDIKLHGHILLAEDGADNQRFISAMLRKAGAQVTIAQNGKIAVELALSQSFDMIFMDMQMPEMDGYAAASKLRSRGFQLPIVALTAHAMAEDRAKCIQAGCTDYLTKPIDRARLILTAARYLNEAADEASSAPALRPPVTASASQRPAAKLISTFADDPVMKDILPEFIAALPEHVARIRELMTAESNAGELRELIHQIKGAGGSYGYSPITTNAAEIENRLKAGSAISAVEDQIESLVELIRSVDGYREPAVKAG